VIFDASIKFNLDPSGKVPDEEIKSLLIEAGLEDLLKREPDNQKKDKEDDFSKQYEQEGDGRGIHFKLTDGGSSLSSGEKQLICICRAVLRRNKIVVLDEATANIDIVTEQKIQKIIEKAFKESTVFTIAHRINTIINSDRVLVMHEGAKAEYDSPQVLCKDPQSKLSQLINEIKKENKE
jgi:ATP-binding cassette subfamily C (CFTR/MRP) protein 1